MVTLPLSWFEEVFLQNPSVEYMLGILSVKTGVKKEYLSYGLCFLIAACLAIGWGGQLLCNLIGFVYPTYCSIKAIESPNKDDDTLLLMYWVVFSALSVVDYFVDIIMSWVPFYWLAKCVFLLWCMSPLDGARTVYHKIIIPWFRRYQSTFNKVVNETRICVSKFADEPIHAGTPIALVNLVTDKLNSSKT